jgi:hypothetical protein
MSIRARRTILETVLGRTTALAAERGERRGGALDSAVTLAESVRPLLGKFGRDDLSATLAELLTDRGDWHAFDGEEPRPADIDQAEADLRRALELNPQAMRARTSLAQVLLLFRAEQPGEQGRDAVLGLFHEALTILIDGILVDGTARTTARDPFLGDVKQALGKLEQFLLSGLSIADLAALVGTPVDTSASGDLLGLVRRARATPGDIRLLRRLLDAIRRELNEQGDDHEEER